MSVTICRLKKIRCFEWSPPWHSIHPIWHSIWHIIWHSIWNILWHSIWQIFWHPIWHIFWHSIWHSISHIFWHSIWHIFWHSIWHIFCHSIWQIFWHTISGISSDILSGISSDILSVISSDILSGILFGILYGFVGGRWGQVEVRRSPQRSDSDPRRLKSGEDHCYQELADEIRRGSLRSRAGRWSPARPTAIKSWQMRSGEEEEGRGRTRRTSARSRASDIKSNNPHLAAGEKDLRLATICLRIS